MKADAATTKEKRKRVTEASVEAADGSAPPTGLAGKKWSKEQKRAARAARLMEGRFGEQAMQEPVDEAGGGGGNGGGGGKWQDRGAGAAAAARNPHTQKQSRHGPHFTSAGASSTKINDEWQTSKSAWAALEPLFARYKTGRVWQPFYYDGVCANHLHELGFSDVIHEPYVDFFARAKDSKFVKGVDFIWDNPPYTNADTKEAVLKALVGTGKPFCMLLPSSVLHTKFVRDSLDMDQVQVLFPRRVMVCKTGGSAVPFKFLVWLCYKVGLERDLYFLDDAEEDVEVAPAEQDDDGEDAGAAVPQAKQAKPQPQGKGRAAQAPAAEEEEEEEEAEEESGEEEGGDDDDERELEGSGEEGVSGGDGDEEEDEEEEKAPPPRKQPGGGVTKKTGSGSAGGRGGAGKSPLAVGVAAKKKQQQQRGGGGGPSPKRGGGGGGKMRRV